MLLKIASRSANRSGFKPLLILGSNTQTLLNCGLFQGRDNAREDFNSSFVFNAKEVNYVLLLSCKIRSRYNGTKTQLRNTHRRRQGNVTEALYTTEA